MDRSNWDFFHELSKFGPQSRPAAQPDSMALDSLDIQQCRDYCRYVATTHYENFQIASWLIPRQLRQDFFNIYAFCRWSDDCADEVANRQQALELLDWWRGQLKGMYRGENAQHPVLRALAETVQRHALPLEPFDALIDAFTQDQTRLRYDTAEELDDYCSRSANPVGRLVLGLAKAADDAISLAMSDSICTGLQLANFCQDMARDAHIGRIYAPRALWKLHAVDEGMILAARPTPQLRSLLAEWVTSARQRLDFGADLPARLPRWLATDVRLFRAGGLAILDQIQRCGFDVWSKRPTVSKFRKAQLLLGALLSPLRSPSPSP